MGRRKDIILPENYYHLYNRGNDKQPIFLEERNYVYFLKQLHHYFDPQDIEIIAHCLMPNHFHLLVYIHHEVLFSNIMRSFTNSYVKSIQKWYGKTGHLFQGDYQSKRIGKEGYLAQVCRYIHLNPVKAQMVQYPEEWKFSDYIEWTSAKTPTSGSDINAEEVGVFTKMLVREELFGSADDYKKFVLDFAEEQIMERKIHALLFG
jgi:REP element-mobilizing transposase RayT